MVSDWSELIEAKQRVV